LTKILALTKALAMAEVLVAAEVFEAKPNQQKQNDHPEVAVSFAQEMPKVNAICP
jgi:hypothetical protein